MRVIQVELQEVKIVNVLSDIINEDFLLGSKGSKKCEYIHFFFEKLIFFLGTCNMIDLSL